MRNRSLVFVFILVLLIHITGIYTGIDRVAVITKPLLVLILAAYFAAGTRTAPPGLKKWVLAALFFSWTGDILLMFVRNHEDFFLAGLSAFLLSHIFYIFFFHSVRVRENIKGKALLLLIVCVYYAVLMALLSPGLGSMKLPVRIYGAFICFMLMLALHMLYLRPKKPGISMAGGALLFVLSDSILAIDKFYHPFREAAVLIMATYGVAQLLIVQGAIGYISPLKK